MWPPFALQTQQKIAPPPFRTRAFLPSHRLFAAETCDSKGDCLHSNIVIFHVTAMGNLAPGEGLLELLPTQGALKGSAQLLQVHLSNVLAPRYFRGELPEGPEGDPVFNGKPNKTHHVFVQSAEFKPNPRRMRGKGVKESGSMWELPGEISATQADPGVQGCTGQTC